MVSLRRYRAKRDFTKSTEPAGEPRPAAASRTKRSFVVQRHDARRLHYDFRLEHRGVLLSWAIPKGPSLDPADRRLAIRTEDHPLEYGKFEGSIPAGHYGAGTVARWDRGTWTPIGDVDAGLRKGHLVFELAGERLRGRFHLTRIDSASSARTRDGTKEPWLLIKAREDVEPTSEPTRPTRPTRKNRPTRPARPARPARTTREPKPESNRATTVESGTTRRAGRSKAAPRRAEPRRQHWRSARRHTDPVFCLATLVDTTPTGPQWLHETKFDGYRVMLRVADGTCRVVTRGGHDWTERFQTIAAAAAKLRATSAMIDGEVVAYDAHGRSRFDLLQRVLAGEVDRPLVFQAFDLIEQDGADLRPLSLLERKDALAALFARMRDPLRLTTALDDAGPAAWKRACKRGLEGLVSKRRDAPYHGGRGFDWVKSKCIGRQEFVIGGYSAPRGARVGFGALLLGVYDGSKLRYAGKVGTGFSTATMSTLAKQLRGMVQDESAFVDPPRLRAVHWVEPRLACEVAFTAWTRDGRLRHPTFIGMREDKDPHAIGRERARSGPREARNAKSSAAPANGAETHRSSRRSVGTLAETTHLTHADKVLFPDAGVTKGDLARYFASIAPAMLPYIVDRPLALVRCPDGVRKECFFQKHAGPGRGPIVVHDARELVALAQLGAIEIHPWGSKRSALERPDVLVLDLDPSPGVPWKDVVALAHAIRRLLEQDGLVSYAKLTGGKGIHVVAPTRGTRDWAAHKRWAKAIAERVVALAPDRLTIALRRAQRHGRIFIDYLRNGRGATAVAPYSPRARAGAPVACPVRWSELKPSLRPDAFGFDAAIARAKRDPWRGYSGPSRPPRARPPAQPKRRK